MKNYIQKVAWALVLLLAATLSLSAKDGTAVRKLFKKGVSDSISVGGSKLVVLQKDLIRNRSLSVNSIGEENVPELDFAMTNVTAGGQGYRFLPHGTHFTGEGATVKIKYDRTRIPSGYTEDDIRTYYYDPAEKHWVALERVRVDKKEECVVSKTTHFTDMINGVIQAPESPQTEGFAPTMMNDIKAADPTAKINVIAPPSANNRGSANLQYPFEMPPARNGMQPSLGLQYSSEGGNGWLGEGWNISVPSITLDTRWGVPRYDQAKETETYLLSGSMLSTMDDNGQMGVAHRGEKMNRKADRQFYTRQGGDFSRIIRKGNSPANYYWEVTDKQGVKYIYGGDGAVVKGNVTDASGNTRDRTVLFVKIACRLVVLFEVRTCSYEFLAFGVAGELLEVLDETTGQICRLLVPLLRVLVRVARIENLGIHARKCSRDLEIEYRQRLGRGLVDRTVQDGVDDAARIFDRDSFARTVPARIDEVSRSARLLHAFYQFLTVLGRMQREERRTEASREGRRRLGDTALGTGQLGGEAREEVVFGLFRRQDRNRGQHAECVGREEDHLLGGRSLRYGLHDIVDVEDRVRYAGVLRHGLVREVDLTFLVHRNVLQQGVGADRVPDIGLVLFREVDDFGIASALEVEDAVVVPTVLVVADQLALRRR